MRVVKDALQVFPQPLLQRTLDVDMSRTIGHIELDLEAQTVGVHVNSEIFLDYILIKAERDIDTTQAPVVVLQSIDSLVKDLNFEIPPSGEVQLFGEALKAGDAGIRLRDCDIGSYIYLSIAERLSLPIVGVLAPQHVFVRWVHEDGSYFNWETVTAQPHTDADYVKRFNLKESEVKSGAYLKSMSKREMVGVCMIPIGARLMDTGRNAEALRAFTKAAEYAPTCTPAHFLAGCELERAKRFRESYRYFGNTARLLPDSPVAYSFMGTVLWRMGDAAGAERDYDTALSKDPYCRPALIGKALLRLEDGRHAEKEALLLKAKQALTVELASAGYKRRF